MEPTEQNLPELVADIEALRASFPRTQDLYREVCAIMFFRYGITPTANKLYQFVRKGSMSAPAEALTLFWDNLREKSRVIIDSPDLPDSLKQAAGALVSTLWQSAQVAAKADLKELQEEAQSETRLAKEACQRALDSLDISRDDLKNAQLNLQQAQMTIDDLRHELTALRTTANELVEKYEQARTDLATNQARLDLAQADFTEELEKQRKAARQSEDRLMAAEARTLVEVDRERTAASQIRKTLDSTLAQKNSVENRYREELTGLQFQLANLSHKLGVQEGELHAGAIQLKAAHSEIERLHGLGDTVRAENAVLKVRLEVLATNTSTEAAASAPRKTKQNTGGRKVAKRGMQHK